MWGLEGRRIGEDDPPGRTPPPLPWSSQASVAVKMVFALAAWGPEFTAQHVKRDMDGVRTPAATLSRPRNFRHIEPILPTTQVRMVSSLGSNPIRHRPRLFYQHAHAAAIKVLQRNVRRDG